MNKGRYRIPDISNEKVYSYAPGSQERKDLDKALTSLKSKEMEIPMYIGGKEIKTSETIEINPPHEIAHTLGFYHKGNANHVTDAITAALKAKNDWEKMPWESRAAIFLKAADLMSGLFRYKMNAATMLGQSKNVYQSEIDAVCELIDFFRFNVKYMLEIYEEQPNSMPGIWNRMEYRPLEGFILAVTPFNFTSIGGNLPCAPALMGNTVVWKPSSTQIYSAWMIMNVLREAGLPDGVINLIYTDGPVTGDACFNHKDFAGIHFTGSTPTFQYMWKTIGNNMAKYRSYPRIVGETGGKNFVIAHPSANAKEVSVALSRGAFEYQGQKCSAASRAYIPSNLWEEVKKYLVEDLKSFRMGTVEDHSNFINAVIDEKSYDKITKYIEQAKADKMDIIAGGNFKKNKGYFIEPTVIVTKDPRYVTMREEIFGPVLSIYVYKENNFEEILEVVDDTSPYALTGSIFSGDRKAIVDSSWKLRNAAGNFYINDKPTAAVVDQQPFGGARASGTNDKAGSKWNLVRWVSPRSIKENFVPPKDYKYPFLG